MECLEVMRCQKQKLQKQKLRKQKPSTTRHLVHAGYLEPLQSDDAMDEDDSIEEEEGTRTRFLDHGAIVCLVVCLRSVL